MYSVTDGSVLQIMDNNSKTSIINPSKNPIKFKSFTSSQEIIIKPVDSNFAKLYNSKNTSATFYVTP